MSELLITETLSYTYLRINPQVPESENDPLFFPLNEEYFYNACAHSSQSAKQKHAKPSITNVMHADMHSGEFLILFLQISVTFTPKNLE